MCVVGAVEGTCWSDEGINLEKVPSCRSFVWRYRRKAGGNETTGVACSHARNGMVKVRCLSNRENILCKHTASSVTLLLPLMNQVQSFTRQVVPVPMTTAATKSCARLLVTLSPSSVGLLVTQPIFPGHMQLTFLKTLRFWKFSLVTIEDENWILLCH